MLGVVHILSQALGWLALATLLAAGMGYATDDRADGNVFLLAAVLLGFLAGALIFALRGRRRTLSRVGSYVLIVALWLAIPPIAALPLMGAGEIDYLTALFEAVSGFTTTGATALRSVEVVGKAGIFFRAELQWLGGFLTLVTLATVLAATGLGGLSRTQVALVSGVEDRLERIMIGVRQILAAYVAVTLVCIALLFVADIPAFDAICIGLATLSTGGFMPIDGTFADYDSPFGNLVVTLFMLVGATSIVWQRMVAEGRWHLVFLHRESYWVIGTAMGLGLLYVAVFAGQAPAGQGALTWVTGGLMTGVSVITTTGFQPLPQAFMALPLMPVLILVLVGGSGLSTAGGLKQYRIGALVTLSGLELRRLLYPHSVREPRAGSMPYSLDMMKAILSFLFVALLVVLGSTILLSVSLPDLQSALTAAIAAFSNAGPIYDAGWPGAAASMRYPEFDGFAKLVFIATMILGRIEVLVVFAALNVSYWRS